VRFAIFHIIVCLWLLWRFWLPLPISRRAKAACFAVTILISLFPAYTSLFAGGLVSPELPSWVLALGGGANFALTTLGVLVLAREAIIFVTVMAGKAGIRAHHAVQKNRRVAIGMAGAAALLGVIGVRGGIAVPEVKRMDLPIRDLPEGLEGMTIVQLSDLHISALLREPHVAAIVDKVNALKPDLIVITGDVVDGHVQIRMKDVAPLLKLRAPLGILVCEGNHEHYIDYDGWMRRYAEMGMTVLKNSWVAVKRNGASLVIGAVTDPWARRFGREEPDPVKAFAGAPEEGPRILLSHQPKYAKKFEQAVRFDVQLSGHTHGGQIRGMDEAVSILNGTFVRGWYRLSHSLLYVHSGSGLWNGFPIRLGVPSEIAFFTLRRLK
jgi:uncharacterized protein